MSTVMTSVTNSPPRAPAIKYTAPLGTRWEKEKAAAGHGAFEHPDDPTLIGPWIIGECVGKGASGRVKIAKHRHTGQLAAVKILPLQPLVNSRASLATQQAKSYKQRLGIDREITMMKLFNHPNIMRIYDVYEGEKELYLVLEYVEGGELFDFLVNRGRLPPLEALAYFKQIVFGLNYAHAFSIIHRDLKPENILIHSLNPPLIKIADWGMAAFAPPALQLETSCGSPHYASPEIVNGEKYEGNATDIWSCGVILYALLTGRLPFDDKDVRTLLGKVRSGKYEIPKYVDPEAKDLLSRMLVVDVTERITVRFFLLPCYLVLKMNSFFCFRSLKFLVTAGLAIVLREFFMSLHLQLPTLLAHCPRTPTSILTSSSLSGLSGVVMPISRTSEPTCSVPLGKVSLRRPSTSCWNSIVDVHSRRLVSWSMSWMERKERLLLNSTLHRQVHTMGPNWRSTLELFESDQAGLSLRLPHRLKRSQSQSQSWCLDLHRP
jgi:serine/threonine protein kinase